MRKLSRHGWIGYSLPLFGVAGVTAVYQVLITSANATTIALSFLLVVLFTAASQGIGPSILASVVGMICLNFFFLPPVGTLTIHDPQDWLALLAFIVTAILASQLSSTARRTAQEAQKRREEVWKLYQLSRAIIITADPDTAVSSITNQVRDVFDVAECDVFVPTESGLLRSLSADSANPAISGEFVREVFENNELRLDEGTDQTYAPLKIGVRVTGVLFLRSAALSPGTIEAIGGLVALALERARFLKELSRTEALRQSDQLKSALLASVSHDLRTPLTSIRAAVDNLLDKSLDWDREALREFHLIISEEVSRLTRLVENLLDMARIEARELHPVKVWSSVPEMVSTVLDRCASALANHRVRVDLKEGLPLVKVDARLLASALANLLENAGQYSEPQTQIVVHGEIEANTLTMSIQDEGPGIPAQDLPRVFDKFYRGTERGPKRREGTGMGLAIARGIVDAHGGKIWVESRTGLGSTFYVSVPVEVRMASELASVGDH